MVPNGVPILSRPQELCPSPTFEIFLVALAFRDGLIALNSFVNFNPHFFARLFPSPANLFSPHGYELNFRSVLNFVEWLHL